MQSTSTGQPARRAASALVIGALLAAYGGGMAAHAASTEPGAAPRVMEKLGRGIIAVRAAGNTVFVSWRLLGLDAPNLGFNLYRSTNGAAPVKLNAAPLTGATSHTDTTADLSAANT
jgi:rhamnogalacturonan endolyase